MGILTRGTLRVSICLLLAGCGGQLVYCPDGCTFQPGNRVGAGGLQLPPPPFYRDASVTVEETDV
jgi:hypothetical protein